jgi:ketosteroid isomerase-like protein
MRQLLISAGVIALVGACAPAPAPTPAASIAPVATPTVSEADLLAGVHKAHEAYVEAINSNDTDKVLAVLTEDIVYQSPHAPALKGKAAVGAWIKGYFGAYATKWEKTSTDMHVAGDWAFELYDYKSTDTPKGGGKPEIDTGKGINIYHHDSDGVWRIARDGWSTDLPIPAPKK